MGGAGRAHFPIQEIAFSSQKSVAEWASAVRSIHNDFIVVDTPPSDDSLAASIALADIAVIPVQPSGLDLEATNRTLQIVGAVWTRRVDYVHGILVPNRLDRRTLEGCHLVEEMGRSKDSKI
jgi:chromosome partitioning protein